MAGSTRCTRQGNGTDLAIISALLDDLRCHPVGGANEGVALAHGVAQLGCHPKVSHLDFPRLSQQDVAALDIPMDLQHHCFLSPSSDSPSQPWRALMITDVDLHEACNALLASV